MNYLGNMLNLKWYIDFGSIFWVWQKFFILKNYDHEIWLTAITGIKNKSLHN